MLLAFNSFCLNAAMVGFSASNGTKGFCPFIVQSASKYTYPASFPINAPVVDFPAPGGPDSHTSLPWFSGWT